MKDFVFIVVFWCIACVSLAQGAGYVASRDFANSVQTINTETVNAETIDTKAIDAGITGSRIEQHENALPGIVPFAEVFALNVLVWGYDRYVTQAHYARISPSIWRRNLREGWQWDDNHWGINFYGHPYQGVYYFVAARSSGFGFYSSFLFAMLGSWEWEHFAEREYPAPNDLVTTSVGGALYGEMLFRLSRRLLAKPNPTWMDQTESFVLHPLSYLHWKVDGVRPNDPGYAPLKMSVMLGGGLRFGSDYRYDQLRAERLDAEWEEVFGFGGFSLEYGNPDCKVKNPAEYFTVDVTYEHGQHERLFNMNTSAKLYSFHQSDHRSAWTDVAPTLNFDTFYGDLVEMGNLSLGLRLDLSIPLYREIRLRYITEPGFLFFGSTDFNYNELLSEMVEDYEPARDYQYNYGVKMLTSFELEIFKRVLFGDNFVAYLMKTMPGTEPHYGAKGYDVVGVNKAMLETAITDRVSLGIRMDSYFKVSAYTGDLFKPMSRTFHSVGIYNRISF